MKYKLDKTTPNIQYKFGKSYKKMQSGKSFQLKFIFHKINNKNKYK